MGAGAVVVRGGLPSSLMQDFSIWCRERVGAGECHQHPNQPGRLMVNAVFNRLADTNPALLRRLLTGLQLAHTVADTFLGFAKVD